MSKKLLHYLKKEIVLVVAWILALISMIFVHPSKEYADYIDFRTLGILWGLMITMEGLKKQGFFDAVGNKLLSKTKKVTQLSVVLVFLCFFFAMLITNDVALITFVPFSIIMLKKCNQEKLMIPVIVMQTIAANLGSMMTPIGNPQNLYLYGLAEVSLTTFVSWMLPYTIAAAVALGIAIALFARGGKIEVSDSVGEQSADMLVDRKNWIIYFLMFILAIFVVMDAVPYHIFVIMVLIITVIADSKLLVEVDYSLLFTFVGFFIFTGNMQNIHNVEAIMDKFVAGHEVLCGVVVSQFISNVPATLLLSGFTPNIRQLVIGVNFGGLGTLIASMASLISYKIFVNQYEDEKGKYFIWFTVMNVVFLVILLAVWGIVGGKSSI